jgi:hypothetical protein
VAAVIDNAMAAAIRDKFLYDMPDSLIDYFMAFMNRIETPGFYCSTLIAHTIM